MEALCKLKHHIIIRYFVVFSQGSFYCFLPPGRFLAEISGRPAAGRNEFCQPMSWLRNQMDWDMWKCLSPYLAHSSLLNLIKSPKRSQGECTEEKEVPTVPSMALELISEETLPAACHRLDHSALRSLNAHIRLHHMALLYVLDLSHLCPWPHPLRPETTAVSSPLWCLTFHLAELGLFLYTDLQHDRTSPQLLLDAAALLLSDKEKKKRVPSSGDNASNTRG